MNFRKIILYGIFKKSTHGHTNLVRVCTFFPNIEKFRVGIQERLVGWSLGVPEPLKNLWWWVVHPLGRVVRGVADAL